MRSQELRDQRKRAVDELRGLLQAAVDEKRPLSAEEREKAEKIESAIDSLKVTIDKLEKIEAEDRAFVPESQVVTPTQTADRQTQYRDAFWRHMRYGADAGELRTISVGTDTQGGYTVPDEFRRILVENLDELNVVRNYATIIPTNSGTLTVPVLTSHAAAAWKAESAAYAETTPEFSEITLTPYKCTVLLKITEELLNDSAFPMEAWIAKEFGRALAEIEETAFVAGSGTAQPTGLLTGSALGKTATATNAVTADELMDLYHSLPRPYRPRAVWLMKDASVAAIRKLVTGISGDKTYLWQPGLNGGEPDTLLGRPVITSADMEAIATGLKPIIFGDLSYYYIAERPGMSLQRLVELYAANGHVGFRIFRRVDGEVVTNDAIKHLIMA